MVTAKGSSKRKRKKTRKPRNYVIVSNRGYGNALKGTLIYFEGQKPKALQDDGRITFGKHILESLRRKFERFRWIITQDDDSIIVERGIVRVRTSQRLLSRMNRENWDRSRDIKNDIVARFFSLAFPQQFAARTGKVYVPGTLSGMVDPEIVPKLSSEDKEALNLFLPDFLASESAASVNNLKATAQIGTLKTLADNLETEMTKSHAESWWQTYVKANILLMQQGYIKALDKMNVAVGDTRFPDFCLITHDNYLDLLEIKKPDTPMLKLDQGRGNYYWDAEMAKAISQTENYIEQVSSKAHSVRSYLLDKEDIDIKVVRSRGIILAGNASVFANQKQRDDFRLLSQGIKSITIVTYDELLARVRNYINVLQEYGTVKGANKTQDARRRRR